MYDFDQTNLPNKDYDKNSAQTDDSTESGHMNHAHIKQSHSQVLRVS